MAEQKVQTLDRYLCFSTFYSRPLQLYYFSLLKEDLSNRDAEHLIGSAWNKENRVPNTVSLLLEITCPAFTGMHTSRPRYKISTVLRNFT